MARVDDFDAFYHATRRPLLHQTYALTGDVMCAAAALEHAYAQAWVQWRKVRRLPDPTAWVRIQAWERAAGPPRRLPRHLSRRRPRGRHGRLPGTAAFDDASHSRHRRDLDALRQTPRSTRKVLVLHHLAELPVDRVAWELGISERTAASLLIRTEQTWPVDASPVATALANVEDVIADVRLSRAPRLRRQGDRRHRVQSVAGLAAASALLAGGGLLIAGDQTLAPEAVLQSGAVPTPAADTRAAALARTGATDPSRSGSRSVPGEFLLDHSALLTPTEMSRLTEPAAAWSVTSTTDGTTGDTTYATCQRAPFADPDGDQSLVRRYRTDDVDRPLEAVQVIEESRSEAESAKAFAAMEDWYARCQDDGVQLLSTQRVEDLGDQARAFELREIGSRDTFLTVGIARTGPITTALVATSRSEPVPAAKVMRLTASSVMRMCLRVSGDCSTQPEVSPTAPLPTDGHTGFLADYDLPKVPGVGSPWVGTDPQHTPDNPAATACDRARFRRAQSPRSRVYVLPTAREVPTSFGVTETVGTFRTTAEARSFVRYVFASAQSCADRELSATRPRTADLPSGQQGRLWRFEFEVTERRSATYRVAVVRSARRVAVLSLSPADGYDVRPAAFANLAVRAGERLAEATAAERAAERSAARAAAARKAAPETATTPAPADQPAGDR
jgi:DNA-directed RNA polymerase specialized sigma24 family protein